MDINDLETGTVFRYGTKFYQVRGEDHGRYVVGMGSEYLYVLSDFRANVEVIWRADD